MARSAQELTAAIAALEAREVELKRELKILGGQARNRDPRQLERLRHEHAAAAQRWDALEKRADQLLAEGARAHRAEDATRDFDCLREAALVYSQQLGLKLDPETWKPL